MKIERILITTAVITALAGCATPMSTGDRLVESAYQHILNQDWDAAETDLLEALEADAGNPYAMLNLGVVYQKMERNAEAMEMYNRVIESNTDAVATRSTVSSERGRQLTEVAEHNLRPLRYGASRF